MESRATLAARNPCSLPASPRVRVGLGTARLAGFERRKRGARLVASGAFGRRSVSVESKPSWELGEGGVGAIACGDHWWRKNALGRLHGFGDFGATTLAMRAFKKKFSSMKGFIGEDHEDGDDEEEEGGGGGGRGSDDDDDDDEEEDTTDDEDEEEDTTDEEDTTEDEDEDEDEDDQEDEGECDD